MIRNPCTANLTKEFIESKISQVSIMSKYLDIPADVIMDCVNHGTLIHSVFRDDDHNGSMGFAINKRGRLKVRDFGGYGFFEDVYGVVAYVLSIVCERKLECRNKQDFYFILKHIANTFSDVIDNKTPDKNFDSSIRLALAKGKQSKTIIDLVHRSWNKYDKEYWNSLGVDLPYLNTHFVIPVDQYYTNRTVDSDPKYYYKPKDPCYAYYLGQNRNGVNLIKLYFPKRDKNKERKFITNCNVLEGLLNLEVSNYDIILITKSSKDRLAIGNWIYNHPFYGEDDRELLIGTINLPSENYHLTEIEYSFLSAKLATNGIIVSLLDFDKTGRCGAKYMQETYNIPYIFITRGELGLPNYHAKDFTELYLCHTKDEIDYYVKSIIDYVRNKYR